MYGNFTTDDSPDSKRFCVRPLRDGVLWERIEYKHPFLDLPAVKTNRGRVVAIGRGRALRRKLRIPIGPGQFHEAEVGSYTGRVRPVGVKIGDSLEFSPRGQKELVVEGRSYVLSGEQSIIGYADESDSQGVMFPASVGTREEDKHRKVVATIDI